jgi:hypothetical protein
MDIIQIMILSRIKYEINKKIETVRFRRSLAKGTTLTDNYSYAGFYYYQCIFIHIPRTAGVAINQSIFSSLGGGHKTIKEYQKIFKHDFAKYFKFSFVRNPWDRLYSAFCFLKQGGFDAQDRIWADNYISSIKSFEEFVVYHLHKPEIHSKIHFKPQYEFICHDKNMSIDFCGYYERLENDLQYICEQLCIEPSIIKKNTILHKDYKEMYTSEMIDKVHDIYMKDVELLGYTFDNQIIPNIKY